MSPRQEVEAVQPPRGRSRQAATVLGLTGRHASTPQPRHFSAANVSPRPSVIGSPSALSPHEHSATDTPAATSAFQILMSTALSVGTPRTRRIAMVLLPALLWRFK